MKLAEELQGWCRGLEGANNQEGASETELD